MKLSNMLKAFAVLSDFDQFLNEYLERKEVISDYRVNRKELNDWCNKVIDICYNYLYETRFLNNLGAGPEKVPFNFISDVGREIIQNVVFKIFDCLQCEPKQGECEGSTIFEIASILEDSMYKIENMICGTLGFRVPYVFEDIDHKIFYGLNEDDSVVLYDSDTRERIGKVVGKREVRTPKEYHLMVTVEGINGEVEQIY